MVDMQSKVSNAVKYDNMNITLEGSSLEIRGRAKFSKKFPKQFRRC